MKTGKEKFISANEILLDIVKSSLIVIITFVLFCAIWLLINDTINFFQNRAAEGIGIVLGSLLIIWVLIELLETQVGFLKGEKLNIGVFVLVTMVAFIRKLLVASIKMEKTDDYLFLLGTVFILSLVYLIVRISEKK